MVLASYQAPWNLEMGNCVSGPIGWRTHITNLVAFSPNDKLIVSGSSDKTAQIWNSETGDVISEFVGHTGAVNCIAFSPDGMRIVSGSEDRTIRVRNTETVPEPSEAHNHTIQPSTCSIFSKNVLGMARQWRMVGSLAWAPSCYFGFPLRVVMA